jgi:hypothetical protein
MMTAEVCTAVEIQNEVVGHRDGIYMSRRNAGTQQQSHILFNILSFVYSGLGDRPRAKKEGFFFIML